MKFYPNSVFHIFNQGNNKRQLFFCHEHYRFFSWKMRAYLLPFGELIGWCLMPNHFHWLLFVRQTQIPRTDFRNHVDQVEYQRRVAKYGPRAWPGPNPSTRKAADESLITLNQSIGILQAAYTRALNKEKGWSGSLFRQRCKAKDGLLDTFNLYAEASTNEGGVINQDYLSTCLRYIHNNPVIAGLVDKPAEWTYSSAYDYEVNGEEDSFCNTRLGKLLAG